MNHPLRSDNWEATDPKHGARVRSDCSGQPSSNRRPNSQVGRLEASCPTRLSRECASRLGTANIDENKYNDRRNTKTRVYAIEFFAVFVTNNGHVSFYAMSVLFMDRNL